MDADKDLAKKIQDYQQVAKENPNVDVGLLMMNALTSEKQNIVSAKAKRRAYGIALAVPPFGLLFTLKYLFSDEDDARQVAWICAILTFVSVLVFWLFGKILLSGSGTSVDQIQKITPKDIQQMYQ